MAMTRTVDAHPKRDKIIAELVKGTSSVRSIAVKYDISVTCVRRYLVEKLQGTAAAVAAKRDDKEGGALIAEIRGIMQRCQKMYDACDDYLRDPENPDRYELGPRAWEIDIVYRTVEADTDKMITRKESLQTLLEKIENEGGYQPWEIRMKHADPRKLILETARVLGDQLKTLAEIEGLVGQNIQAAENPSVIYMNLVQIIQTATKGEPKIRERILEALEAATPASTE